MIYIQWINHVLQTNSFYWIHIRWIKCKLFSLTYTVIWMTPKRTAFLYSSLYQNRSEQALVLISSVLTQLQIFLRNTTHLLILPTSVTSLFAIVAVDVLGTLPMIHASNCSASWYMLTTSSNISSEHVLKLLAVYEGELTLLLNSPMLCCSNLPVNSVISYTQTYENWERQFHCYFWAAAIITSRYLTCSLDMLWRRNRADPFN